MKLERWVATGLVVLGVVLFAVSVAADLPEHDQRRLLFIAIDCVFFSLISVCHPRSNAAFKHDVLETFMFVTLALAVFGAVAVSLYLIAGTPDPISDELISITLAFGLAAALIVPLLLKHYVIKARDR